MNINPNDLSPNRIKDLMINLNKPKDKKLGVREVVKAFQLEKGNQYILFAGPKAFSPSHEVGNFIAKSKTLGYDIIVLYVDDIANVDLIKVGVDPSEKDNDEPLITV